MVGGLVAIFYFPIYIYIYVYIYIYIGLHSSSQLTNSIIFQRGGPTTNQKMVVYIMGIWWDIIGRPNGESVHFNELQQHSAHGFQTKSSARDISWWTMVFFFFFIDLSENARFVRESLQMFGPWTWEELEEAHAGAWWLGSLVVLLRQNSRCCLGDASCQMGQ